MIILCWSRAGGTRECRGHRVEDAGRGLAGATVRPGSRVWPAAHWDHREDGGVLQACWAADQSWYDVTSVPSSMGSSW